MQEVKRAFATVEVFLIDSATVLEVESENVRPMPKKYVCYPKIALPCRLSNVTTPLGFEQFSGAVKVPTLLRQKFDSGDGLTLFQNYVNPLTTVVKDILTNLVYIVKLLFLFDTGEVLFA